MHFQHWFTFIYLPYICLNFSFKQLTVGPTSSIIGVTTTYTIIYERSITNTNSITNWNSEAVPGGSTITVTFPSDYTLSSPSCLSISINSITVSGFSCANSGNTITVSGAIPNAFNIDTVQLNLGNILNPVPAIYTGEFNGVIGSDVSVPVGGGVQLYPAAFDSCSITFDSAIVNQTSTMVLTLDPKNSLSSAATILISTPRRYSNDILTTSQLPIASSMVCANYSSGVATAPTCAGNTVLFTITASNLLTTTTTTSFSFGVKSMTSPPTLQPSDSFTITSYIGAYQVDTCTIFATGLIANTLTSVVITPISTMTVNTNVGLRFDLTLPDFCDQNDDLQITFPSQILPSFVNVSGSGVYNSTTSSVSGQVLSVVNRRNIVKLYSKGSVYTINFYQIKAPPSTKTTSSITVKIIRNGFDKMTGSATIQAVSSTLTGTVLPTLSTVNKVTTYGINITITDGLSPQGMVKIVFPTTITLTVTTGCATLVGTSVRSSPTCTYDSSTNSILISSMNSSSSNIPAQTLRFTISGVKNPPSVNPSGSFSVTTYYTTDTSGIVSVGTLSGITASLDIIDASRVSVVPTSYIVSDTSVTYTLNFVNGNSIPQNGYAQITIPSGVTLNVASISSYCQLSLSGGSFFSTICAGVTTGGGYYVNFSSIAQSTTIASGTSIALRISSLFTNPSDTSIVSTFTIKTYHSDTYGIEQLTTGISVQMTTPSTFTSMSVSRTSETNSDPTAAYTFRLKQSPNLPSSAKLKITYPSSITLTGTTACTSLTSVSLTCVQSTGSIQIQLISAVSSGTQFGVTLSNIINPPSFAPLASAFTFLTTSSDRLLSYASGSLTSSLQDSIPSSFASLSGQFSSRIYGEATNLQITVTPSSRIVPSYMLVTVASSFTISTLSCTSWSCTSMSSNVIKINSITSTAQISFTITGITAPKSAPSDYTTVSSYDSGNFLIDQNSATIIFSIICTMPCRTCSGSNSSSCITCYTDTSITTYIYLYSTTSQCYSTCPSNTYPDSSTFKCVDCSSICLTCTGTSTNCTSCLSNSTYPYLFINSSVGTCRTQCPTFYYPDTSQNPIVCVSCISPCSACTSSSQCTSCLSGWYFYNNTCSTNCPSGTTIPNNSTNTCDSCSVQCAMCSGTVSTCIGCSSGAALYNGTCVTVCPTPYVIYNGACVTCSTNCLTCSLTYSNCTSCSTSSSFPYLYINTCLANCPQLYYSSISSGQCILCSTLNMGCDNCTSTSTCGTCNWNQGYVFLSNRCFLTTPVGYYNSSGYALPCDSTKDCSTCLNLAQNCTACISLNLQGNLCVSQCRAGFVGINQICVACTSNCKTCSNLQSNCTSCLPSLSPSVYLTNYQCLTTCPDYTYPNTTTSECTNCISPCQKCTSASSCSTCLSGFFLYNSTCQTVCPYGYFGVNRICVRCTSPCDACSLSLTVCTACVTTYYLVSSTSTCVTICPTGLYPNSATGTCTGCVSPCSTCSTTASTCTSCLNSLNLFNGTCVPNCPDGYYLLNSQCNSCNVNCTRCTSSSVCQSCVFGLYLYNGNCISTCPSTSPVTTTGSCTPCTDTNCLVCNSLDQCSSCNYPTLLLFGDCLNSCPTDYVSNTTHCNYSPTPNTTENTNSTTNTTLNQTLSSSNLFPVPFTIAGSFIGIACIMSKFQHPYTFISGSLYSLWSVLQWGAIGVGGYLYYLTNKDSIALTTTYIQAFVFIGAVGFMYFLNILALISQACYLRGEEAFRRWQQKEGSNSCFYTFCTIFGGIITHKFKNIIFCKLFGFDIFKARLNNVQSFRIFNIFSFLSIIPSAAILFSTSYMIYKHQITDQQLMGYIDILVLTTACIILSIFNSRKDEDFFEEKDEDGIIINKRIIQSDSIMQEAIVPFIADDAMEERGGNLKTPNFDSERRFKSFQKSYQTISDAPSEQQFNYIVPAKSVHNISIQAAPVLQDYSKIDFYNDEQLSDVSMFRKVDKSINMTKQLNANQVSVQNDMNIFDHKQVSIQYNPQQGDMSVQHEIDVRDISLQNAPNMDDHGMQMSHHEEDHSIQVGVLVHNASIQYSAKPVFEDISQDFVDQEDEEQEVTDNSKLGNQLTGTQKPAQNPQGLKAELQLDVDEKLRQRQEQMQMQRQLEIARKKQQMLKKFHEQQQKKLLKKQTPAMWEEQYDNLNNIYNNQNSRADGSSLMDSNANIMVHFQNNSKKNIIESSDEPISSKPSKQVSNKSRVKQAQHERIKPEQRAQSAKTEKELIQLLSNNNNNNQQQGGGLDLESSVSFNVTRDLQSGNQNGRRIKNVVYEEQDKNMDSGDEDDIELQSPQRNKKKQIYILQNDSNEQIPSGIQKSRSTNFLSTNGGRRPPLPHKGGSKYLLDDTMNMQNSHAADQYEEINYHPIKPVARHAIPSSNYKEEDLDYQAKTNLNQFIDRRKNNPVSAHQFGKNKLQTVESDQLGSNSKEIKQNPLPLPKIERLKSQQSNHSHDNSERLYKMNTRKALLEDRKLQFDDEQKIDLTEDYESQQKLPPVSGLPEPKLRKIRSQTKMAQRDNSYEKPVHRQLLGKERYVDRTQKFLQKEYKKAESTKKKIQMMQVMLQRPNITNDRGYLKQTYSSQDKKKKSQLEKVYMNNPFEKRN